MKKEEAQKLMQRINDRAIRYWDMNLRNKFTYLSLDTYAYSKEQKYRVNYLGDYTVTSDADGITCIKLQIAEDVCNFYLANYYNLISREWYVTTSNTWPLFKKADSKNITEIGEVDSILGGIEIKESYIEFNPSIDRLFLGKEILNITQDDWSGAIITTIK